MIDSHTSGHERVRVRTARRRHTCWAQREHCSAPGDGHDGKPACTRSINPGEKYVESTIYPGHDSGYADAGPLTSRHCLPCGGRWANLRRALEALGVLEPATAGAR